MARIRPLARTNKVNTKFSIVVMRYFNRMTMKKIKIHLEPQYVMALWRSICQLGIRGVERVQYWRLFFWTLFRRPRLFRLAITFAIYGFHFRQVVELHIE